MQKLKDIVIYEDNGYNAFPSIARGTDGTYYLTFWHAPDRRAEWGGNTHMDEDSVAYLMTSADGVSWSNPQNIKDWAGYGKRCQYASVHALVDGSILVSHNIWKIEPAIKKPMLQKVLRPCVIGAHYPEDRIGVMDGAYASLISDGGSTVKGPFLIEKNCFQQGGKIAQLPDGTILAPVCSYEGEIDNSEYAASVNVVLYASTDSGVHWEPYSFVSGLINGNYAEEPTLFMTKSGKLCCFMRTTETMYYCFSDDQGHTWSEPVNSGLPGEVPYNALQLRDGRIFLSYGNRAEPYGIRALMLNSELNDISPEREIILRDDGSSRDLSYTWAESLPNGDILVTYYFQNENIYDGRRHIAGTILRP